MGFYRFSSGDFPARHREAAMRDLYAAIERVDIEPTGEGPLFAEGTVRSLSSLTLMEATCSPCVSRRTASHVSDGKDDLVLCVQTNGLMAFAPGGREAEDYAPGDAYLGHNDRPSEHRLGENASWLDIVIPRVVLGPRLADLDGASRQKLPSTAELRLLTGYVRSLNRELGELSPDAASTCANHIVDLAAMAVGATRARQSRPAGVAWPLRG